MSSKEEQMGDLIENAKRQVIEWYNPTTPRKFIESCIWSASIEYGEGVGSQTRLFVLQGGEAKGTILADYFNGVVIAYDRIFSEIRVWKTIR